MRRWISPLDPTALFSIIFKHPTRKSVLKNMGLSSFQKEEEKKNPYRPTLIKFFNVTPIKPYFFLGLNCPLGALQIIILVKAALAK